jgi:NADH:ubiquinone oxidoreductase subunit 6 (subunit J)
VSGLAGFDAWSPWVCLFIEDTLIELCLGFFLLSFLRTGNLFYGAVYLFAVASTWATALAVLNLEVLTSFLIIVELTAILIIIIFLMSLNFEGRRQAQAKPPVYG